MSIQYGFCTCNAKHFQLIIAKKWLKKIFSQWNFNFLFFIKTLQNTFDISHLYDVNLISKIKCFYFKIKFTLVRSNFERASEYWSVSWLQSQTRSTVSWPNSCVLIDDFGILHGVFRIFGIYGFSSWCWEGELSFLIFFAGMFLTPMPFRFRIYELSRNLVLAIVRCKNKTNNVLLTQINIQDKWARTVHFCHRDHYLNSLCFNFGY